MANQNRCPTCGPVPAEATSFYCATHRGELLAECERYVAAWARSQVARGQPLEAPRAA